MLGAILIIMLILLFIGALPIWGYSKGWGYYQTGGVGLLLIVVIILLLIDHMWPAELGRAGLNLTD